MNDQFPPASWFLRPNTLAHWMPNMFWGGVLAAPTSRRDPWDQSTLSGMEMPTGGFLASLAQPDETEMLRGGLLDNLTRPNDAWKRRAPASLYSATSLGANSGFPATAQPPAPRWENPWSGTNGLPVSDSLRLPTSALPPMFPSVPRSHPYEQSTPSWWPSVTAMPLGANVDFSAGPADTAWRDQRAKLESRNGPEQPLGEASSTPSGPPVRGPNSLYNSKAMFDPAPEPAKDFPTRLREALSDANVRYYLGPGFYEAYQKLASLAQVLPGSGTVQATQDASRADEEARAGNYGRAAVHLGIGTANAALDWFPPAKVLAILGGGLATTFPRTMLPKAFDMEAAGRSVDEIWQATGLGRTADGRWIFEIPDKGFRVDPAAGKLIHRPYRVAPLYEQIVHPGARQAYPDLASLKSYLYIDPTVRRRGLAWPDGALIRAPDLQTAESVAMHELQHLIRQLEGGSGGYPPQHFMRQGISKKAAYDLYERQATEVEARNAQWRMHMSDQQRRLQSPQSTEVPPRDQQIHIFDMP